MPGVSIGNTKDRDATVLRQIRVGPRHQVDVRRHMAADVYIFCPLMTTRRRHAPPCIADDAEVRASLRFGEAERERELAGDQLGMKCCFCSSVPAARIRRRAAASQSERNVNAGELLLDDILRHAIAALATVLFWVADPQPAAVADLFEQVVDQRAGMASRADTEALTQSVHLGVHGFGHVLGDEDADVASQRLLFRRVSEVHVRSSPSSAARYGRCAARPHFCTDARFPYDGIPRRATSRFVQRWSLG